MELRSAKTSPAKKRSRSRSRSRSKKVQGKRPRPESEEFPIYEIPQSKLDNAERFLEADPAPPVDRGCYGNIVFRQNTGSLRSINCMGPTLDMARFCSVRGLWPELMQTVAIQCEHSRTMETRALIRNALYTILADPSLADPSYLRSFLLANPACRNEADVDYCIGKILEVFQGVTINPKQGKSRRRSVATDAGRRKRVKRSEETRDETQT